MSEFDVVTPVTRSVRYWACGGTGIDLLRDYRETSKLDDKGIMAKELDTYIDTSDANMHGISNENVYRVKGIDGGGKDREVVKAVIQPLLPEILLNYPAGDLNVVLYSLSGGTGSAIGPMIVGHLLKANHAVISVVIDDSTSSKAASNGINTMTDLESIARQLNKSVVVHYSKNDPTKSIMDNDALSKFVMGALSILGSGKNSKLDSADINNFINFSNVTHHQPGLARLTVTVNLDDIKAKAPIASFAALLGSELSPTPSLEMDYDAIGYMPSISDSYDKEFFYAITPTMNEVVDELIKARENLAMRKKVTHKASSLLGDTSDGFDGNTGIVI